MELRCKCTKIWTLCRCSRRCTLRWVIGCCSADLRLRIGRRSILALSVGFVNLRHGIVSLHSIEDTFQHIQQCCLGNILGLLRFGNEVDVERCPHRHQHRRLVNTAFGRSHHGQQTFGHTRLNNLRRRIRASRNSIRYPLQERHRWPGLDASCGFLHLGLVSRCLGIGQSLGRLGMFNCHPPGFSSPPRSARHILVLHEDCNAFQSQFGHLGRFQWMGQCHTVRIERKEDGRMHRFPGGRIIIDG